MILTWHNDACYNILVVQNTKKTSFPMFFPSNTPKNSRSAALKFFFTSGVSILSPKVTDGHFTCDELKKSIFGCSCSGCKKCPEAVFFLLAILAASWGLVVHHITISEFSSILQGWKDGCQQYHSNTQVFFLCNLYDKRLFRAQSSLVGEM